MSLARAVKFLVLFMSWAMSASAFASARSRHAAIWSIFEMKSQCEVALGASGQLSYVQAIEPLLYELVNNQSPKAVEPAYNSERVLTWFDLQKLSQKDRDFLASRLAVIQDSFFQDKDKHYSFGHAVQGERAIADYVAQFASSYEQAYADFDPSAEMKSLNDRANVLTAVELFMKSYFVFGIYLAGLQSPESGLYPTGIAIAALALFATVKTEAMLRLRSHFEGEIRYQRLRPNDYFSPSSEMWTTDPADLHYNVFVDWPMTITAKAFEQLRHSDPESKSEMKRSCLIHSPSTPCEENTAFREIINLNDFRRLWGFFALPRELSESAKEKFLIRGRMAFLFYRDKESGEPTLIHWITFDLPPGENGRPRRTKKEVEQKQESVDWGGGLKPVTLPVR